MVIATRSRSLPLMALAIDPAAQCSDLRGTCSPSSHSLANDLELALYRGSQHGVALIIVKGPSGNEWELYT